MAIDGASPSMRSTEVWHLANELSSVRRQTLHVTTLAFCIDCIHGQRTLAASAGTAEQFSVWCSNCMSMCFKLCCEAPCIFSTGVCGGLVTLLILTGPVLLRARVFFSRGRNDRQRCQMLRQRFACVRSSAVTISSGVQRISIHHPHHHPQGRDR